METVTRLELRPITELAPYACNARVHSDEQVLQLRASLREFGFVAPVLIDAQGNILAGHGRVMAAKAEGMTEVPCVLVEHLTDIQRRAYILADNRLAEQASWDDEMVSLELQALREVGFDFELTGFDAEDIVIEDTTDIYEDDYDPAPPTQPKARRGQIYQLGRHRLMCGDATVAEDVLALMDGATAQLLLTDPPYNVDYAGGPGGGRDGIVNDAMDDSDYETFLHLALSNAKTVLELGGSYYLWHADGAPGRSVRNACHRAGLPVRQCLVWVKQSSTLGRQDYQWQHEPCLHGQTETECSALECGTAYDEHEACLYGWRDGKAHLWRSDRKQTTVLEFDRPTRSEEHPTMKPVRLMAYQVANSTLPEAVVLDLFAGSGTTAIACEQLGRVTYMMELDPAYVDVIIDRWEAFTGSKAVLLDGA